MKFLTLDSIVRSVLLKRGKSLHFYIEYLAHACSGLRKLNTMSIGYVNSAKLPVNSYFAVTIPCDYVDWVRVGFAVGERVRPLIYDAGLNRLNNYDSTGAKIPYTNILPDGTNIFDSSNTTYIPQFSGDSDAIFNHSLDRDDFKFNVLKERNEIQLSADYPYEFIILDYIPDGLSVDAATQVESLAAETLEKYILWQVEVHSRNSNDSVRAQAEKRFNDEHRLLRASKNEMTGPDYIAAVRSGYAIYR